MERTNNIKIDVGALDIRRPIDVGALDIRRPIDVGALDIKTYHIPGLMLIEDGSLRLSSFGLRFLR